MNSALTAGEIFDTAVGSAGAGVLCLRNVPPSVTAMTIFWPT